MNRNKMIRAAGAILIASMIAGCSGDGGTGGNATDASSRTLSAEESAAPSTAPEVTLRLLTDLKEISPPKPDWAVWKWVKEETNINIEQETWTGPESLALAIASGDMPDLFTVFPGDAQKYGPQGAFIDLSKHLDQMPNVKSYLESKPEVAQRMTSPGGEMYHVLNDGTGAGNLMVWFYRDDVFAKHNLQPPTTWDELYETSKQLKELYPNSYPFTFRHGMGTLRAFGPAFGVYPYMYEAPDTGKIKYGVTDPGFKVMIEQLNKFYQEKLIPQDFLSMDYKSWTQQVATDKTFMTIQYIGQIEIMNSQLQNGAHLKFMAPPLGYGDKAYIQKADYEDYGIAVSSKTNNLDGTLRYLDFIYSEKGKDILSWGKEGETYTMEDGNRKFLPQFKEPSDLRKELGIFTSAAYGHADFEASLSLSNENEQYSFMESLKYQFPTMNVTPLLTDEEKNAISAIEEQLNKYYESSVAEFIIGETAMSQWDAFVEELGKIGSQKVMDTYQVALDRLKNNIK
ncbi:putative aldouronate transport system substrate-binding protein [Paenibacillus endophyticus]|uniref:Putative aldouronate transport system substrate-binding protein n=1 Tax=Paenibacillus endophyticus TaxID=1294268 RepID=A0A7W5G8R4_9BACL|nr:extracellular solute-binding protein [Paenibacillus endophyticus]MBB3150548.1 putative aldouronate transport system substrate-binding protein [Paenibacillus endophyticus]